MQKRKSKKGYAYYSCEKGADCGFMTWDVPTELDCPQCGQTMFKKSGKGRMKPFCINEACPNFLPEEKRGYYKKKTDENAEEKPAKKASAKKPAARKSAAKKTVGRKKKETGK
jgi:DNA topoisomerase-1